MYNYITYVTYALIVALVYIFRAVQHNSLFQKLFYGRRIRDCHEYTPSSRMVLIQYGSAQVEEVVIVRTPIQTYVNTAMNFLTGNKFNDLCRKFKYNNIFHISLLLSLHLPNHQRKYVVVEKTQIINISEHYVISGPPVEYLPVKITQPATLLEMVRAVQAAEGENFFAYDFLENNCQTFAQHFLQANHIHTSAHDEFLLQDINSLQHELPKYVRSFTTLLVRLRGQLDKLLEGLWMEYLVVPHLSEALPLHGAVPESDLVAANSTQANLPYK